jgi:hypothetical protein
MSKRFKSNVLVLDANAKRISKPMKGDTNGKKDTYSA